MDAHEAVCTGIIFDCDGVVFDSNELKVGALKHLFHITNKMREFLDM